MRTYEYNGERAEKSSIRYIHTKWMDPNKCCGIFFVHKFGQVHQSIIASKESVFVSFRHNYDYFILCDN